MTIRTACSRAARATVLAGALLVSVGLTGGALAQSPTPTSTPVNTATFTPTPTPTSTLMPLDHDGSTDFAAFHRGSFRMDPTCNALAIEHITITIPGLKLGDMIVVYTNYDLAGLLGWNIIANNKLGITLSCSTDSASHDWEYIFFSRTQNNCQGAQNCKPAATVTSTPTP